MRGGEAGAHKVEPTEPAQLMEVVEAKPAGDFIRMEVSGLDMMGRDVTKIVMLGLGPEAPPEERLRNAGLEVMAVGDDVQIMAVQFGSEAERYGIDFGMNIQAAGDAARVRHVGSATPTGQARWPR
jgi:hypothetical protein